MTRLRRNSASLPPSPLPRCDLVSARMSKLTWITSAACPVAKVPETLLLKATSDKIHLTCTCACTCACTCTCACACTSPVAQGLIFTEAQKEARMHELQALLDVEKNHLVLTYLLDHFHLLTCSLTHYFYALLTGAPGLRAKLRRRLPGAMRARGRLPAGAALLPVHPRQGLGSAPDSEQHLLRPRSVPSQLATPKMARDVYCLGSYPLSGDFGPPPGPNFLHPPTEYL